MPLLTLLLLCIALPVRAAEPSPAGARVYIVSPADGAEVTNPVTIVFGLEGMGIAPAGVQMPGTGHHHLLVDTSPDAMAPDEAIPASDQILHLDGGETEVTLELPEGTHTLRLLLGDADHRPHLPPVASEPFTVTVE